MKRLLEVQVGVQIHLKDQGPDPRYRSSLFTEACPGYKGAAPPLSVSLLCRKSGGRNIILGSNPVKKRCGGFCRTWSHFWVASIWVSSHKSRKLTMIYLQRMILSKVKAYIENPQRQRHDYEWMSHMHACQCSISSRRQLESMHPCNP